MNSSVLFDVLLRCVEQKGPYLLFLLCITLYSLQSDAQTFTYKQFTIDDGLPSNRVYHVVEDQQGYIWAATDNGLARYDGYEWVTYGSKDGLRCSNCWNLQQTTSGAYLISGNSTEANILSDGQLYPVSLESLDTAKVQEPAYQTALSVTYPSGITFLTEDSIYVAAVLSPSTQTDDEPRFELQTLGSRSLRYRWQMRAFYAMHHGLDIRDTATVASFRRISNNRPETIRSNFFFVTEGPLLGDYYILDGVLERCYLGDCVPLATLSPEAQQGALNWQIGSDGKSLQISLVGRLLVIGANGEIIDDLPLENLQEDLIRTNAYLDTEGNRWVSTANAGVFCLPASRSHLKIYGQSGSVRAITASRFGLIVAREKGLDYLHNGRLIPFPNAPEALSKSPITYLNAVRNGREVFVSSFDAGLRIDSAGFTDISDHVGLAAFRYSRTTRSIYQYNHGTLQGIQYAVHRSADQYSTWTVGSQVIIADPQDGHFELDPSFDWRMAPPPEDLDHAIVYGKHELFQCDIGTCDTLFSGFSPTISYVKPLMKGRFYIGTENQGVYVFDSKTKAPPVPFYALNEVNAIAVQSDSIWLASSSGLVMVNDQGEQITEWNAATGLPSNSCTGVSLWRDSIAVVSGGQLVLFKRNEVRLQGDSASTRLHLRSIMAGENQLSPKQTSYQLSPDQRDLALEFVLVRPTIEGEIAYSVQLMPFDEAPNLQRERKVNYSNLSPGNYTFHLTAIAPDGVEYQLRDPISFEVLPAWHERWLVRGLFMLVLIAGVVALFRRIENRRRNRFLRKQEALRKTSELRLEALRSQMNPHFVFNALGSIQYYIQKGSKDLADEYLGRFAKLMRGYLDSSKQRFSTIADELELIKEYVVLEQIRFDNTFDYAVHVEADFAEENLIPSMLLQPFVENAILHGLASRKDGKAALSIVVTSHDNSTLIRIEDNGQGRENSARNKRHGHKSQATRIIKERIEALQRSGMASIQVAYDDLDASDMSYPGTRVSLRVELLGYE